MAAADVGASDAVAFRQAVPEIVDVGRLLDRVEGQLALASGDEEPARSRIGWL